MAPELVPNLFFHTNGRTFELLTDLTCIVPLHGGSSKAAQTYVVSSQTKTNEAIDALRTFHSSANRVEWYERTPNDAQQTESVVLYGSCRSYAIHHVLRTILQSSRAVVQRDGCDRPRLSVVSFCIHFMTGPHHSCLISSNTLTNFSEG
ncbi:hypothetical protein TNCV_4868291 [Trichonephila clavipes]|nr:hypothetical protein TNCV_4868291 [Trichonephila clavipes]